MNGRIPAVTPNLRIDFPPWRRHPGLPIEMERDVFAFEVLEGLLDKPIAGVEHVVRCILS